MIENLNFFIDNWYVIATFICALILAINKIIEFIGYPTKKKIEEIKNRLLFYVTEAELELGEKTGQIKLSQVYDEFCKQFPYIKKWISLEKFSDIVDDVLPEMRKIIENTDISEK